MSLEVTYVGRLAHRLLSQQDLARPLNVVDPKSKVSYFQAARHLSELGFQGKPTSAINASLVGPTAAYWQNIVKPLKPGDAYLEACDFDKFGNNLTTTDPTQAM